MKTVTSSKIGRFLRVAACFPALIVAFVVSVTTTYAATMTIFQENFDNSPPYTNGASLPTSWGQINYGRWSENNGTGGTSTTSTNESLSSTRSLELYKGGSGIANVIARFGEDNTQGYTTSQSITVRFAFNLVDNTYSEIYIVSTTTGVLGLLNIGSASGSTGLFRGYFNGSPSSTISFDLNKWYYVTAVMSANPGDNNGYSFSLYESDGVTQVGTTLSGGFYQTAVATDKYTYVTLNNYYKEDSRIYYDNISVTAVPEPGTVALIGAGLLLLVFRLQFRRKSSVS